ncbi:TetR/AcrR family transcriptional regulator [Actinophytocola sediminis]
MTATERTPARRPRNRKAQLAESAADLFGKHGYHQVGVNDIAAAAGVTGPAVYRHFRGKQDILAHVLLSGMDVFGLTATEALTAPGTPADQVSGLLRAVAGLAVERREVTALWRWEGRHLDRADQHRIRRRGGELMGQWGRALRDVRPDLSASTTELLCWAALSVFGSVSVHHVSPPRRRFEALLADLAQAVLDWPGLTDTAAPAPVALASWQRVATPPSRRAELLAAATRLFRDRGYHAVSMEDIGAAAGIAGPSIYRYFPGKAAILVAAGYRMGERLARSAKAAIGDATDPQDAIGRLAESYVDTVLRSDNLMATFAGELANLPDRDRKELVRVQRDYVAHWIRLVRTITPELAEPDARVTVHAALTVVNDLARTPRIVTRPRIAAELTSLAVTVLSARK